MAESIVMTKSFAFSLKILTLTDKLQKQRQYALADQLFRSGTGIGSNVEEAAAGISRDDFRAKMGIAAKEARETRYWLRLMKESGLYHIDVSGELNNAEELVRILTSIVKTLDEQRERERKKKRQNYDTLRETEVSYMSERELIEEQLRTLEEQIESNERKCRQQKKTQNSNLKTQNLPTARHDGGDQRYD